MKHSILAAASVLAVLALFLGTPSAGAQEAPADAKAFVIWLVAPSEEIALVEPLTAYMAGVECGTQTVEKGKPAVVVGGSQAPDACRTEGTPVTLVTSNGLELFTQPTFAAGTAYVLENLVPGPPHSGATPAPSPSASGHGVIDGSSGNIPLGFALSTLAAGLLAVGRRLSAPLRRTEDLGIPTRDCDESDTRIMTG